MQKVNPSPSYVLVLCAYTHIEEGAFLAKTDTVIDWRTEDVSICTTRSYNTLFW